MEALAKVGYLAGGAALLAGGLFAAISGGHSWTVYTAGGVVLGGAALVAASFTYDFFTIARDLEKEGQSLTIMEEMERLEPGIDSLDGSSSESEEISDEEDRIALKILKGRAF